MKVFKDNADRTWSVAINVDAVKRIRDLAGLDILAIGNGDADLVNRLADDPILLVDVLYAACKPEADTQKITPEDFGKSMGGDAIDAAVTALMAEIVDFFPSRRRAVLKAALAKVDEGRGLAMDRALTKVTALDMKSLIEKAAANAEQATSAPAASGDSSTSSPASPASIPAP